MRRIYMQHRWLRLFCGSYVHSLFGLLLKFFFSGQTTFVLLLVLI